MNRIKVSLQQSIIALAERGWSKRRIARELQLDRATVTRHLTAANAATNPAHGADEVVRANAATNPAHGARPGPASLCAPFAAEITAAVEAGLSAMRIHQDLCREHGFRGGYTSVKQFVRRLVATVELPFRRIECAPGAELQFDFGTGAIIMADGKRRRPHLFRAVLSHSRKAYSEVVWRQDTETVLRCLENTFRAFGGVPSTLVPDNLKAAVLQADWFDPEFNPKLRDFCAHYGTALLPTRPAMPRHKGKIEAGIKYVQGNALRGRRFASLAEQNTFLLEWERTVADTRLHGTIRQQVGAYFLQAERAALRPLPASLFPCFEEAKRIVHRDGHVAFRQAYYSAPPEYVGREVWVRAEARVVRLYNLRLEPIAVHARAEPGHFATADAHIHSRKRAIVERGAAYLLERCRLLGAHCGAWAEGMLAQRGPIGLRVLQGLLALAREHPIGELEHACGRAVHLGRWRLRQVRQLLQDGEQVVQIDFLQAHPLIRDLRHYQLEP
ncbi:MAG: IS21 family transposase [Verrucomicrobia bacterium]|nr:IS21 family transposase [Verrucomicrobiota bacterium]